MSITEITPAQNPSSADNSKRRKAKAILAGGLVLGIGAAVTLAAWNDSEFVFGDFSGGHFRMVGSTDGVAAFENHDSSNDASRLSFTDGFDNLSRNETVAAPYVVHLDAETDYSATVRVASAAATDGASEMRYGIIKVPSVSDCSVGAAATPENTIVPAGTQFNSDPGEGSFELTKPGNGTAPGENVYLCFRVSTTNDLPQDTSAKATWEFVATTS